MFVGAVIPTEAVWDGSLCGATIRLCSKVMFHERRNG